MYVKGVRGYSDAERFTESGPESHQLGHIRPGFEVKAGLAPLGFQHPAADELLYPG